jgi:hypothetical protein
VVGDKLGESRVVVNRRESDDSEVQDENELPALPWTMHLTMRSRAGTACTQLCLPSGF